MVVILPVFRAILTGAGTLLALHLTSPQLTEPLYELALAGAKELAVFGASALSSRFDIFAWLLGTGAAWNSIRLAEKAKHALGQWHEAGEHYALHPARVEETLEENAKWLGLLNVDLSGPPLHAAACGKELMVVPQPFLNIDVCIPGEVGFWDADAAAAFEAAMGAIADVSIVPDPPDQGVCAAAVGCNETFVSLSSTAAAAAPAFNTTITAAAFFQPTAKSAAAAVANANARAIVVEPAIAAGHAAQPINISAFTAGFHAHDSGPPPHGHMSHSTSASAIAPLAVPQPAAAANATKARALVHWGPEDQPYERAAPRARAADHAHWYLIVTGCMILVRSLSCRQLATQEQECERPDTDSVFDTPAPTSTAAPLAIADSESAIVPDYIHQDMTPADAEEEDGTEDENTDTIDTIDEDESTDTIDEDEDAAARTTGAPGTADTATCRTTTPASLPRVIFDLDPVPDSHRGWMRASAEGGEGRAATEQDRDALGIDSGGSTGTVVEDATNNNTTTAATTATVDAVGEHDAPAPVVLDGPPEVELSDDKHACKIDTEEEEEEATAAVGLLGSIWARQDGGSENTAPTAPEPALSVEGATAENRSMQTTPATSADTVNNTDAPVLAPVVQDVSLEVDAGMDDEKDEPAEADAAVGLLRSIWAPQDEGSENTAPTAPEPALDVEDADTEEKNMATIVTTTADTVSETDAPALAPVVQDSRWRLTRGWTTKRTSRLRLMRRLGCSDLSGHHRTKALRTPRPLRRSLY
ncbi:hypothetical protein FIBSPDRAFT_457409 [Athelia psychrophila]|uniref:Uncharacterized protein n=1 Tax=Athelia psychrophila TaxID=1759441 RepID=A0A166LZ36_9AGAM|nr:hypothetical protein FIBSPDRAFT_457409 [Fibularhizoctonia sp. CBS 109695]